MDSSKKNSRHSILIGGDLFPAAGNLDAFVSGQINQVIDEKIIQLFQQADYSICNLEGALTDHNLPIKKVDPQIRAPKSAWNGYKQLNLSAMTLANNHVLDYGLEGFLDTIEVLDANHIEWLGAGEKDNIKKSISVFIGDKKIIIYNVSETMFNALKEKKTRVNLYDEYQVCSELKLLKQECDYLIVIYHGGTEFYYYGSEWLRTRFHRMADCGADLIIAQHTHCIGLQEKYNGAELFYGQGDFLFSRRRRSKANPTREYGLLLEVQISDNIEVRRHLLRHIDDSVIYDERQEFTEFDNRSEEYRAGNMFEEEYSRFSDERLIMFLEAFRGQNIFDKIAKRILSKSSYDKYLINCYSETQLLRIISGIAFEEYREAVIKGLWNTVNKK